MNQGIKEGFNQIKSKKVSKFKIRKPRKTSWTIEQQTLYIEFLKKNMKLMKNEGSRRANQVFKKMSAAISTRTAVQAKTHHQKLEQKYQTNSNIIHQIGLLIKKTLILQAQQKENNTEKLIDEPQSSNIATQSKVSLENLNFNDQIKGELTNDPFFQHCSERCDYIQWHFMADDSQPLI